MSIREQADMTPRSLINPKSISAAIEYFFGRGELSQVVDQTNPLAQLTHERRLSALGPGGLNRKRAGFEVRDVHISHYGRICPIETPEGTNIGLISSLSIFAGVDDYGFLITPYRKIVKRKLTDEICWLRADEESAAYLAPADTPCDGSKISQDRVTARFGGDFLVTSSDNVQYIDISPKQMVGVSAGLIPFLEHDDANRALMGSNMQRQAVPLLVTEPALVSTGLEKEVAKHSGMVVKADRDGVVTYVDAQRIRVDDREYPLRKFVGLNERTCLNQKPIVKMGQKVKKGQIIADGAATYHGELSLGRNVLVAFMAWDGYNFEDAIIISEKLVKEDTYTSIHIEEFEIEIRETKLGKEEFTRDIPNVVAQGPRQPRRQRHRPHRHLRGSRRYPRGQGFAQEQERADPRREAAARHLRPGRRGRQERQPRSPVGRRGHRHRSSAFQPAGEHDRRRTQGFRQAIQGNRAALAQDPSPTQFRKLIDDLLAARCSTRRNSQNGSSATRTTRPSPIWPASFNLESLDIRSPDRLKQANAIFNKQHERLQFLVDEKERRLNSLKRGDELPSGVQQMVKVYVATKRQISVGDKMAGRHGNKGVISKILPEEDMPYLADGTPVDILLNPLGVPSRMNVGQILETHLGYAAKRLGFQAIAPVFDGAAEEEIRACLKEAGINASGKSFLYDGRTGERFEQPVTVGYIYMLKLHHLVDDKVHARATGPYSLITQQPLGGKARFGGQRFGEMEVWALEAYGAAYILQELLTVKSDDVEGRTKIYESMVKGENTLEAGTPASFDVLTNEIRGLALNMQLEKKRI